VGLLTGCYLYYSRLFQGVWVRQLKSIRLAIMLKLSRTVLGLSRIVWDYSIVLLVALGRDYTGKTEIIY